MNANKLLALAAICVAAALPSYADTNIAEYDIAALVYPGYHPEPRWKELGLFPEGQGEWFNVKDAKPKWPGHYQPRVPVWGYLEAVRRVFCPMKGI